jgi:hypothetical protein
MSVLLEYECRVPVDGYKVITVEEPPAGVRRIESIEMLYERMLYESAPSKAKREKYRDQGVSSVRMLHPRSRRVKFFDLFEKSPTAYLEFAQKPPTEDGIKDLADRYGPLLPDPLVAPPPPPDGFEKIPPSIQFYGRRIDEWEVFIGKMHRTVKLWDMSIKEGDFGRIIRAVEGYVLPAPGSPISLFLKADRVRWIRGQGPLSASARLCIRPATLRNAIWTQLLLAIDGNVNLATCVQCRKWFTIESGRGRSDKEYCSNACRMRAYRKRKGSG